jgi:predicted membrane channel-forming protein YqfA (hemolysin III family)
VNTKKLKRGLLKIGTFIIICFVAPVIVHQAFKNQEHPFFWPVLALGISLSISAIIYGFWAIKILINALLGDKKTKTF